MAKKKAAQAAAKPEIIHRAGVKKAKPAQTAHAHAENGIMCEGRRCVQTLRELALEIGAPDAGVLRLLRSEDDCPWKNKANLYDVEAWREFWGVIKLRTAAAKTEEEEQAASDKTEGVSKAIWDVRKTAAQARILEIEEEVTRGDLIDLEEAVQVLCELVKQSNAILSQAPQAMAPDLIGLELPEFSKRLKVVHREALEKIYNGLSVKKKAFWRKLLQRLSDQQPKSSLGGGANGGSDSPRRAVTGGGAAKTRVSSGNQRKTLETKVSVSS